MSSKRGFVECPRCKNVYATRWKPANYSNCHCCGFHLGGSKKPSTKKPKSYCPVAVVVMLSISSARTSARDNRCKMGLTSLHDFHGSWHFYSCSLNFLCRFVITRAYEGHFVLCYKDELPVSILSRAVRACYRKRLGLHEFPVLSACRLVEFDTCNYCKCFRVSQPSHP